jgi:hypothetical protein
MQHQAETQPGTNLNQRLDAYATSVQANRASGWKERLGGWRPYAAALGSGLALTTAADADIIYSGPLNLSASINASNVGSHNAVFLTIASGHFAASVRRSTGGGQAIFRTNANAGSRVIGGNNAFGSLKRFASGARITFRSSKGKSSLLGGAPLFHRSNNGATFGQFQSGVAGFAGFVLPNGDLGWISLKWQDPDFPKDPDTINAMNWAYQNAYRDRIKAGQTKAMPEPSGLTLALLAAGSAGVLALRKRRRAETAASQPPSGQTV